MESQQNFFLLVNKLENLVQRFEAALGGASHPIIPVDAPVAAAPVQAPAPAQKAPVAKANPVIEAFEKEVLSKVKAMEDAAKALPGDVVTTIVRTLNITIYRLPNS